MRCLAAAGALLTLVTAISSSVAPASAARKARAKTEVATYCARYLGGSENCGFTSMQQCLQSLSGNGGNCLVVQQMPKPKGPLPEPTELSPRDEDDTED